MSNRKTPKNLESNIALNRMEDIRLRGITDMAEVSVYTVDPATYRSEPLNDQAAENTQLIRQVCSQYQKRKGTTCDKKCPECPVEEVIKTKKSLSVKLKIANGKREHELHIHYTPIIEKEKTISIIQYILDETETKIKKRHLMRKADVFKEVAKKLRRELNLQNDKVASIVHDLKVPLTAITNYVYLLKEEMDKPEGEKVRQDLEKILNSVKMMTRSINDILCNKMHSEGKMKMKEERAYFTEIVKECIEGTASFAQQKNIEIRFNLRGKPVPSICDISKIEHAITNLLSNAIKFSPNESTINILYSNKPEDNYFSLEIADQGTGIPEEELEYVFDPYYQANSSQRSSKRIAGFGLGLYIVKNIIELHEGTVRVKNKKERGCKFIMKIPKQLNCLAADGITVLAIDPDSFISVEMKKIAEKKGFVLTAQDLYEAERAYRLQKPDIVIITPSPIAKNIYNSLISDDPQNKTIPYVVDLSEEKQAKIFKSVMNEKALTALINSDHLRNVLRRA